MSLRSSLGSLGEGISGTPGEQLSASFGTLLLSLSQPAATRPPAPQPFACFAQCRAAEETREKVCIDRCLSYSAYPLSQGIATGRRDWGRIAGPRCRATGCVLKLHLRFPSAPELSNPTARTFLRRPSRNGTGCESLPLCNAGTHVDLARHHNRPLAPTLGMYTLLG